MHLGTDTVAPIGSNESGTVVLTFGIYKGIIPPVPWAMASYILTNPHESVHTFAEVVEMLKIRPRWKITTKIPKYRFIVDGK